MALDNVTKEIVASVDKTIAEIRSETDQEVKAILGEADVIIAGMKDKEDKRLKESIERLKRQEISSAELESKKIVLSKKKEILAKAFNTVLENLEAAPKEKKLKQYKSMVDSVKSVINNPSAFISKNDEFTASDLGVKLVKVDSRIRSGIIFQSEDGTVEVDMQYVTILQSVWDRDIKILSDKLFG